MQGQSQGLLSLAYPKLGTATYSKPLTAYWPPKAIWNKGDHPKLWIYFEQAFVYKSLILPKKNLARYGVERGAILPSREDRVENIDRLPVFVDPKWKHRLRRAFASCHLSSIPNHSLQDLAAPVSLVHHADQIPQGDETALQTNGCCLDRVSFTSYHSWWNALYVTSFSRSNTWITNNLYLTFCLDPKGRDRSW